MMKRTHLMFAFLLFLVCNFYFKFPVEMSVFAIFGAMLPDIDFKFLHRKLLHNLWVLGLLDLLLKYFEMSHMTIVIFSLGFVSHLLSDSFTVTGVSWLWPLKFPHIEGGISTGGLKEYVFAFIILCGTVVVLLGVNWLGVLL